MEYDSIPQIRRALNEIIEAFQMLVSPNLSEEERLNFSARIYYGTLAQLNLYLNEETELRANLKQVSELVLTRAETLKRDVSKGELKKNRYAHRALEVLQSPYGDRTLLDYTLTAMVHLDEKRENLGRILTISERMDNIALNELAKSNDRYSHNVLYPELRSAIDELQSTFHELFVAEKLNNNDLEMVAIKCENLLNSWSNLGAMDESEVIAQELSLSLARFRGA